MAAASDMKATRSQRSAVLWGYGVTLPLLSKGQKSFLVQSGQ